MCPTLGEALNAPRLEFTYTDDEGVTKRWSVAPVDMAFRKTQHHPEGRWYIKAQFHEAGRYYGELFFDLRRMVLDKDWFPMASVPYDNTTVLVLMPDEDKYKDGRILKAEFHPNCTVIDGAFGFDYSKPLGWLPMPVIPKTQE